jgi:hypothetical protein
MENGVYLKNIINAPFRKYHQIMSKAQGCKGHFLTFWMILHPFLVQQLDSKDKK